MLILILLTSMFVSNPTSVYDFSGKTIDGKDFNYAILKGKKILVVNTASQCGFTPQYDELEKLFKKYNGKLAIIGFPANNFGAQELGNNSEIATFCEKKYGVNFLMMSKVSVKGDDMDPFFKWLTSQPNPDFTGDVKWNFEKFLIDENGKLIHRYRSSVTPLDPAITNEIEK